MLDRPLPRRLPEPPPQAARAIAWRLLYQLAVFGISLVAIIAILVAIAAVSWPARSASYGYCQLWARAVTEIEVRSGQSMDLTFVEDELRFIAAEDPDIAVADANLVQLRADGHYKACRALPEYDDLPLPNVASVQTDVWARMLEAHSVGRQDTSDQGTAPATDKPVEEGWAEACGRMWRTFNPDDGTVVRPAAKGGKVRCPLVKGEDGAWVLP